MSLSKPESVTSSSGQHQQQQQRRRNGPNMFTAIRTNNPALISKLREVLVAGVESNYFAKNYIVPLEEAHLTITVFELVEPQNEQFVIQEFQRVLTEAKKELARHNSEIEFRGLECFGDKVLYANPYTGIDFLKVSRRILEKSITDNASIMENHCYPTFNPHLTMFHIKGANHDDVNLNDLSNKFHDTMFGTHQATSIQLCKMGSQNRTEDGYWHVISEFNL